MELPGRGSRMDERAFGAMRPLVYALADGLAPLLDGPYVVVGHSFGAAGVCLAARERRDVASASLLDPWSTPLDEEASAAALTSASKSAWRRLPRVAIASRSAIVRCCGRGSWS